MRRMAIIVVMVMLQGGLMEAQQVPSLIGRGGWVAGYFPSWSWQSGSSKAKIVAMNCFTHIIWVCGSPSGTGISWNTNAQAMLSDCIPTMRANGIKSIFQLCCDWSSYASSASSRAASIHNLMEVLATYNMDGIDIDWEPQGSTFPIFVQQLRDSMDARWPTVRKEIVSYANPNSIGYFTSCYTDVDQINIQGYDWVSPSWSLCSGNGNDYRVVWHQGPAHNGGALCPMGQRLYNLADVARSFEAAGIPSTKLGISARWNGSVWRGGSGTTTGGASRPLQTWTSAPTMWNDVPYYYWYADVGKTSQELATWPRVHDAATGATYLSNDESGSANDFFISYDDGWACAQKVQLAQDSLYGGVYVWTIDGGEQVGSSYPQADSLRVAANRGTSNAITGTFVALPDTLPVGGGNTTLTWTSQNATAASIDHGIGTVSVNGSRVVAVTATTTYTLSLSDSTQTRYYSATVTVRSAPPPPDSNKALGRPAVASSVQEVGFEADKGNDGNSGTRWGSAYTDNQWWQVDLGSVTGVNRVMTDWEDAYASQFKISVSTDSLTFTDVATRSVTAPGPYETQFTTVNARFVRITGLVRSSQWGISLWEVGVYGPTNPGGQGHQDITAQASSVIALITQPTGRGNTDIEIIRDGFTPPVGSSDTTQQYATYTGGGARSTDWIGYQFATQHTFSGLTFQEGIQFPDGGWFTSLNVQVRVGGTWTNVQNLQSTPPYAGANGVNYESYDLSFTPITGDRIRITGTPGGSAHYISVAELRVFNDGPTSIPPDPVTPKDYALFQNYPNPFNPTTRIWYYLPAGANVTIKVYNILGQEVSTLTSGYHDAGRYSVEFSGENMTNGVYFYSLRAGNFSDMKKMVLLK